MCNSLALHQSKTPLFLRGYFAVTRVPALQKESALLAEAFSAPLGGFRELK